MLQTPRTPPNGTLPLPDTNSTPYSKGVASSASHLSDLRRDTLARWLVDDVAKTAQAPALAMLRAFTQKIMPPDSKEEPGDVFQRIVDNMRKVHNKNRKKPTPKEASLKQALEEFLAASTEAQTYRPFVVMTNKALDILKDVDVDGTVARNAEYDILLQHNDPSLLYYKLNSKIQRRKPDSIFITLKTARILHEATDASWTSIVTRYATVSPTKEKRLDWGDALCSIEHKRGSGTAAASSQGSTLMDIELKDLSRFSSSAAETNTRPPGTKCQEINQGGGVLTTGTLHSMAESPMASQVETPPQAHNTNDWKTSVTIQAAGYGLGRLCCSYDMSHAFTLIVVDGVLYLSWYDHEGIITTTGFGLAQNFQYYLALLFILQRFDRSSWGRCEDSSLSNEGRTDESVVCVNGKKFHFNPSKDENVLRKPFAIAGRATTVYRCSDVERQGPRYVIKFSWKEESRLSESQIYEEIRARVTREKPMPHATPTPAAPLTASPVPSGITHAGSLDEEDDLLSYLPEVVTGAETTISTSSIREALGLKSHPRRLVMIAFVELDGVIKCLKGAEYWQVLWDCIRCHKRLWKLGIHHRDISNGNLMYYRRNGHLFGTLIDFDLAAIKGLHSENQRRTGTRPFMALELLLGTGTLEHQYKHDAESFFWVTVYDSASQASRVDEWGNLDNTPLSEKKCLYLVAGAQIIPLDANWPDPGPIRHWLRNMRGLLSNEGNRDKDWGVDELYNTLRSSREDGGAALPGHIKTRQAMYIAGRIALIVI